MEDSDENNDETGRFCFGLKERVNGPIPKKLGLVARTHRCENWVYVCYQEVPREGKCNAHKHPAKDGYGYHA